MRQPAWERVHKTLADIPILNAYKLEWGSINEEEVLRILVEEHDFSQERITKSLVRFKHDQHSKTQRGLGEFF